MLCPASPGRPHVNPLVSSSAEPANSQEKPSKGNHLKENQGHSQGCQDCGVHRRSQRLDAFMQIMSAMGEKS